MIFVCQIFAKYLVCAIDFHLNVETTLVARLPATTVTDRYGKEPYSPPIVTQAPGRAEVTEEISS